MTVNIVIILAGLCCISSLVRAMIVTKYKITPAPVSSDIMACGETAGSIDFCAARVTNDTCEPLTRDWCEAQDMSLDGSYLIKQTIRHVPEVTYMTSFKQPVPIDMTFGSEVEMKFVVRSGWTGFSVNLKEVNDNEVLHTMIKPDKIFTCWKEFSSNDCQNKTTPLSRTHYTDTKYVIGIKWDVSSFQIYVDGEYIWSYIPTYPVSSVTDVRTMFRSVEGDIYRVTIKI